MKQIPVILYFRTRQLWNSKADLGTSNFLAPKSPVATSASSAHKNQLPNGCAPTPTDVVRPDEQVSNAQKLF